MCQVYCIENKEKITALYIYSFTISGGCTKVVETYKKVSESLSSITVKSLNGKLMKTKSVTGKKDLDCQYSFVFVQWQMSNGDWRNVLQESVCTLNCNKPLAIKKPYELRFVFVGLQIMSKIDN